MTSLILGIETSCDETSAAVLADGRVLKSHIIASQTDVHQRYGGVVPEIASREHCLRIDAVVEQAMQEAESAFSDLAAVAVTYGPGLVGSLLVGVSYAKALAYAARLPLIGVNHLEGHVFANVLEHPELSYPLLALLASGGHTNILYFEDPIHYRVLGRTRDDAAGEALDKVARALGLGYPGGPLIEQAALRGNEQAFELPRALLEPGSLDFSFSGMKSAVLNLLNTAHMRGQTLNFNDVAASFQRAVVDVLVTKALMAVDQVGPVNTFALAGGVAANARLRTLMAEAMKGRGIHFVSPSPRLCTDNGAMIATAGYYYYQAGIVSSWKLNAIPGLNF